MNADDIYNKYVKGEEPKKEPKKEPINITSTPTTSGILGITIDPSKCMLGTPSEFGPFSSSYMSPVTKPSLCDISILEMQTIYDYAQYETIYKIVYVINGTKQSYNVAMSGNDMHTMHGLAIDKLLCGVCDAIKSQLISKLSKNNRP